MAKKFRDLDAVKAIDSDPIRRARVDELKRGINDALALAELRGDQELTQSDLAKVLGVSQARISQIERDDDLYVSTLRGYVEALGGRLELRAVFEDADSLVSVGEKV
jgi:DNA-binding XRE family transcriptional regulator